MLRRIAVGDIMTRNFVAVKPTANLHSCAKELVKQRVNSLLISEGKNLIGILTARDILWTIIKKPDLSLRDVSVTDVATRKVAVIKPSADITQALNKMKQYGFRRLPVLSRGELVGMVTLKDILKVDPSLYDQLGELGAIREESQKLRKLADMDSDEWDAEGICEECDSFAQLLKVEGRLLCPNCRDDMY
ncbi:MAG: CBS domain-containing protein [Nanoarchaeota archaeon]|nr:CBS domain-containing protein [Nanoarchaeota archaeon]